MKYTPHITPLRPIGLVTLPFGERSYTSLRLACEAALNLDIVWLGVCVVDEDNCVVFKGNWDDVHEYLAGRVPKSMKNRWTKVPAELEVPSVLADHFAAMLSVNVDNKLLSDADFRKFIRNTLPIVIYSGGNRKKEDER